MSTEILYGEQARFKLKQGVDIISDAVKTTLGPKGRNVGIAKIVGPQVITKDGVTVARRIEHKDPFVNMGVEMVKEASKKVNDEAGDGTTTVTVLAQALVEDGFRNITAGANPTFVKRGMDKATEVVVEKLKEMSKEVSGKEIYNVATISANNDTKIGNIVGDIFTKIGSEGVVTLEDGKTFEDEVEYVNGMQIDSGYVSQYFSDPQTLQVTFEDAKVLVMDHKLTSIQDIQDLSGLLQKIDKPLVIVADEIDNQALSTLVINHLNGAIQVACVNAPGLGDKRTQLLEDICIATGANFISSKLNRKLDSVVMEDLGSVRKVEVSKDKTIFVDGDGEKEEMSKRLQQIKGELENAIGFDKVFLEERYARLLGGVAVINVGGASQTEIEERKQRYEDAISATRAALQEGIVPGGGLALHIIGRDLKLKVSDKDEKLGVEIVKKSLSSPLKQIAENAGKNGDVVAANSTEFLAFDAKSDMYVNLLDAGIIDPVKVTRLALLNAVSVATMLITTEALIAEVKEEEE